MVGGRPSGGCPRCGAVLRVEQVAGPTSTIVHRCDHHGTWSAWNAIGAVADATLRSAIAKALCANDAAALRGLEFLAVNVIQSEDILQRQVIRAIGRAPTTTIGIGSAADAGVFVISADGRHTTLVTASSRWKLTKLVAAMLGVLFPLIIVIMALTTDQALVVSGLLAVSYVLGVGMFAAVAMRTEQTRILFDCSAGQIHIQRGGASASPLPSFFACATRVDVRADPHYGDDFNVMLTLPTAELWVDQPANRDEAIAMAKHLAEALNVPFHPTLRRWA